MNPETIIREAFAACESGDMAKAGQYMTDDFTFSGPVPQPVGKADFLALQGALIKAIPNWRFNARDFKVQGNTIRMTLQVTGTHTATLNSIVPGMPAVPPTNKKIVLPDEPTTITMRRDKIASLDVAAVPGGGVPGIMAQIGAPAMH